MRFGIMQGRLSPPQGQALQFFPEDWRMEFALAKSLGFESIEWIFDKPVEDNPISTVNGRREILFETLRRDVRVESICADVFMKEHLIVPNAPAVSILQELMKSAARLGVSTVMIPFVEGNLPETEEQFTVAIENVTRVLREDHGEMNLTFEIDLPVERVIAFVEAIDSPRVGVCYDTGNAMTFGFDAGADIRKIGEHLKHLHIKDRLKGTRQSVYLGTGSVGFADVFAALSEIRFQGVSTLQAWRAEDYLGDAKRQLEFVKGYLKT